MLQIMCNGFCITGDTKLIQGKILQIFLGGSVIFGLVRGPPQKLWLVVRNKMKPKKIGRLHDYRYLPDNFHNGGFGHFSIS